MEKITWYHALLIWCMITGCQPHRPPTIPLAKYSAWYQDGRISWHDANHQQTASIRWLHCQSSDEFWLSDGILHLISQHWRLQHGQFYRQIDSQWSAIDPGAPWDHLGAAAPYWLLAKPAPWWAFVKSDQGFQQQQWRFSEQTRPNGLLMVDVTHAGTHIKLLWQAKQAVDSTQCQDH